MTGPTPPPYQFPPGQPPAPRALSWPQQHPWYLAAVVAILALGVGAAAGKSSADHHDKAAAAPFVTVPSASPTPADPAAASVLAEENAEASTLASVHAVESADPPSTAAAVGLADDQGFAEMTVPHCSNDQLVGIGSCDFTVENTTGQTMTGTVELTILVGGQSQGVLDGAVDSLGPGQSRTVEVESTSPLPTSGFQTQFGVTAAFPG